MKKILSFIIAVSLSVTVYSQVGNKYLDAGNEKYKLEDYKGAIADHTKAIEINPQYAEAYCSRGIAKLLLDQKEEGCSDLRKAGELGEFAAYDLIKKYCQ